MEAFEKWADKEDEDPRPYGSEEWARKCGWRAALKWLTNENGPLDKRVNNCDYVRACIKKELEKQNEGTEKSN